ncbi:MAG: hydroxyphenylacetyl-CoA thioesterase PaaI [Albidovulum sp.]|nr:hydroxyphenylacetyl-CoA thioesterase PaaI [Albidovulum sp.]
MTPEDRAQKCAESMWSRDSGSKWLGAQLEHVGPGTAVMSFTVAPNHLNGHGICHGGFIFALADSAFAFACNSRNRNAVAVHNTISYLSPGKLGEKLTARAREVNLKGRSGVYDVSVSACDGRELALFRGVSRIVAGSHFDEENIASTDTEA